MQIFIGAKPPSKNRALVGSPLKSSAVTVHLAGSGTLKLERISSVYVHSWERHCVALDTPMYQQAGSSLVGDEDEDLEAALGLN